MRVLRFELHVGSVITWERLSCTPEAARRWNPVYFLPHRFQPHETLEKCLATLRGAAVFKPLQASFDFHVELVEAQPDNLPCGFSDARTSAHRRSLPPLTSRCLRARPLRSPYGASPNIPALRRLKSGPRFAIRTGCPRCLRFARRTAGRPRRPSSGRSS